MSQPTPFNRQSSFANYQAANPSRPLPGATVDSEFNAVKETLDEVLTNLALIQRDDGALANGSVGLDQLSAEIEVGWQAPTVWVTATAYVSGDTVFNGSGFYRLLTAHTSGTFSTDLAAGKWELIVNLAAVTIVAATQIANTPAGSIAATTVQAAIDELASEKAASSHTHPSSAITDGTAAGRTLFTAANAAAQRTALGLGDLALEDTIPVTDITAQIAFTGDISPAALASDINDWAPTGIATCSTIRVSASVSGVDITGMLAPAADGDIKVIENVGTTYAVTLQPSSASSAAANRFLVPKPIVIGPNSSVALKYDLDGTTPRWRLISSSARLPRGWIDGLKTGNGDGAGGGDAVNDITVQPGEARGARGILDLVLTAAITKQLDADWAAGTAAGGRYVSSANTPAIANTTYHVHLISKADGTTDVMFYTDVDASAVLPSGYIDYCLIASIVRAGGSILAFTQHGDFFQLATPVIDIDSQNPGASAVTRTLASVPTGIEVQARINAVVTFTTSGGPNYAYISSLASADTAPGIANSAITMSSANTIPYNSAATLDVWTNTSAQIRSRLSLSGTNDVFKIRTMGWIHPRGRNS